MTEMPDGWEYYDSINSHGERVVTIVNLGFQNQSAVRERHKWLLLLFVEHGTVDRLEELERVQGEIKRSLGRVAHFEYVARTDRSSASEFWLYSDRDKDPTENLRLSLGTAVKFFVNLREDPEWSAYFRHLLPQTPAQLQQVLNGKTLRELRRQGDNHRLSHTLAHRMNFRTPEDLAKCSAILEQHGFSLAETKEHSDGASATFVQTVPELSLKVIDEATTNLVALADRYHGKYDGWETRVLAR